MIDDKAISTDDAAEEAVVVTPANTAHNNATQSAHSASAAGSAPTAARKSGRGGNGAVWFVLLVLVAVLAVAAWFLFHEHKRHQGALANLQERLTQQQQEITARQETLEANIDQQIAQQQELVSKELSDISGRVEATNARVVALSNVNRDDWKLAEAEYLLRFADQRVLLERNSSNAVALAQTADEILRQLNDAALHPVRRALSAEIGELRLAGDIDREGVYLRLTALAQQIEQLPLVQSLAENDDPWMVDEQAPAETESVWAKIKRGANKLLQKFSHHLRVRDHTQAVPAVLAPDSQAYLKQNMRLMVEQAQLAFLRDEAQIYQASLEKAEAWLNTHFPLTPRSVAVRAEISELQNVTLAQSLPTFAESTRLLKTYIEQRNQTLPVEREGDE